MPKPKAKRNKAYKPRPVRVCGGLMAIANQHAAAEDRQLLRDEHTTDLSAAYWLALDAMVRGNSREEDWSMITCALNIGMVLCERDIGREYEPLFITALDGAFRAKLRADQSRVWRYDGEALRAIREALTVHDEQVKVVTKEEIRNAMNEVHRRIDEGNVYMAEAA